MSTNKLPVALFNGVVVTTNGLYRISDIDIDSAKKLIHEQGFISAVGHESTAKIMSELFEEDIPLNRIAFTQEINQQAIVFKLNVRPEEGIILTKEELQKIGYGFKLMERLE